MHLTIREVAQLCRVGERTVYRWVQEEGLPAETVNGTTRVNPPELLEWATARNLPVSPFIFRKMNGGSVGPTGLADALERGGVVRDVPGDDRESALAAVVGSLPLPDGFDRPSLVQLLLAREHLGSTAVGDGIAIPHPRKPVALPGARRVARLCFLARPLDFAAADGRPVHTLFVLVSPTVREHLQLLAHLAAVLRDDSFRRLLRDRPAAEVILSEVRRLEQSFHERT
ncbi:MAG TPA: PTS sugar transporter subunit IIA [Gemmataceae bacterium]